MKKFCQFFWETVEGLIVGVVIGAISSALIILLLRSVVILQEGAYQDKFWFGIVIGMILAIPVEIIWRRNRNLIGYTTSAGVGFGFTGSTYFILANSLVINSSDVFNSRVNVTSLAIGILLSYFIFLTFLMFVNRGE